MEMSDEELDSGLLGIALSDSEDSEKETEQPRTRAEKNAQSEDDFQKLRGVYRAKIDNGEIWKTVKFPLEETVSKPQAQELLHVVEELYFFRRYREAVDFVGQVFGERGGATGLDDDTRALLKYYEHRCVEKMGQ